MESERASACLAERDLLRQVRVPGLGVGRKVRFAPGPHLVVRGLEALPQRFGLRARHVRDLAPLLLQVAHLAGSGLGIGERLERLHLRGQLLLDAQVRPSAPFVRVAQLLDLRRQRRLRGLEAAHQVAHAVLASLQQRQEKFRRVPFGRREQRARLP